MQRAPRDTGGGVISTGATALILSIFGAIVFHASIGRPMESFWMYSWAASGVLLFLSLAIGVWAAIRGDGRGMGIVAVIVAVVAGIISEIR
ncbi:MAG: hypothetical protein ACLQLG_11455 [Thermoguttaceae bacterium]